MLLLLLLFFCSADAVVFFFLFVCVFVLLFRAIGRAGRYAVGANLTGAVPPTDTLNAIIDAMPIALQFGDGDFRCLPVHWACFGSEQPVETVRVLIDRCPTTLFARDKTGKLPIMYAALRDT